jgi:hypothetical protein
MDSSTFYQIRVRGHLDVTLGSWFEGFIIANQEDGDALVTGPIQDQAALYGILNRIANLGLTLISVNVAPEQDPENNPEEDNEPPDPLV